MMKSQVQQSTLQIVRAGESRRILRIARRSGLYFMRSDHYAPRFSSFEKKFHTTHRFEREANGSKEESPKQATHSPDEWDLFRNGKHQWLRTPYSKKKRRTLEVQEFKVPHDGLIQLITLNEPGTMNALSQRMVAELGEEVESIHEEKASGPSRAVVLASAADKAFCAGANLKERASMSIDQ